MCPIYSAAGIKIYISSVEIIKNVWLLPISILMGFLIDVFRGVFVSIWLRAILFQRKSFIIFIFFEIFCILRVHRLHSEIIFAFDARGCGHICVKVKKCLYAKRLHFFPSKYTQNRRLHNLYTTLYYTLLHNIDMENTIGVSFFCCCYCRHFWHSKMSLGRLRFIKKNKISTN